MLPQETTCMNKWKRLFINRTPILPEQRENVKVICVMAKLVPDTADSFLPRKKFWHCKCLLPLPKAGWGGKTIPVQLLYCVFPIMPDMFRSLSVRQLWRNIQFWSVHPYQSHIHLLGHSKSITGNDLGDIVTKQSLRT